MHFKIIKIGKTKSEYKDLAIKFITFLLPHKVEITEIKESNKKDINQKTKEENEKLEKALEKDIPTILLTEKGKQLDSHSFAELIESTTQNTGKVQFLIGGAYGFSEEFKQKFKNQIALSKLTFPHDLAFILLLEQVYRSTTILKGKNYHY